MSEGTVGPTVAESTPWWPRPTRTRDGAPNVVTIVLDDTGYAQLGCYGSAIDTPHCDGLAADGVKFSNFHVTPLCSPTRASLLTGRNHHSVGMGYLADFDTGYPCSRGAVTPRAATIAEMLGDAGYATYLSGKWHLTPPAHMSPAGPFDQWPTGRGFDRSYGFLWGEDDQWAPELWYDRHRVDPPDRDDYHLSEDLVDRAQEFLADHLAATPERPFYLHLAFGACHAPHQAPPEYGEKYRGRFDHGWDTERERVLARQVELGVVPEGTALAPPNPGVQAWDDLSADEQRLYARMQEVFAGFLEHTDAQIGRLVEFLRRHGMLDDTVIVLMSDNGASGEGGEHGSLNEYRYFLGLPDILEENLAAIDDLGGAWTHNHYPAGWAQAGNTPLKYYKAHTHGGGVRAPLILRHPARLPRGEVRHQFHHVVDVAPTILELTGADAPTVYRGVPQLPVHGVSMTYACDDASAPTRRPVQYFETAGHRGIYRDGWKAVTLHTAGVPYDEDRWELYDLSTDFSESRDLASTHPELVDELTRLWWDEAEHFGVLPLDDRQRDRAGVRSPHDDARTEFVLLPGTRLMNGRVGPDFSGRTFHVHADVERPDTSAEGVLLAHGRRAAGFSLFVQDNRLHLDYNLAGHHTVVSSDAELPTGRRDLGLTVTGDGDVRLSVGGTTVGSGHLEQTLPGGFGCLSTQCGLNAPSPVSPRYASPFAFTGTLHRVVVSLGDQEEVSEAAWIAAHARQ